MQTNHTSCNTIKLRMKKIIILFISILLSQKNDAQVLLGMTYYSDGLAGGGAIFEYNTATETYTNKINFNPYSITGENPSGSLLLASNGLIYGMTYRGGINDYGTIFEYNYTTNTLTTKYSFDLTNGASPQG